MRLSPLAQEIISEALESFPRCRQPFCGHRGTVVVDNWSIRESGHLCEACAGELFGPSFRIRRAESCS